MPKFDFQSEFSVKKFPNLSIFFSLKKYSFCYWHFLITSIFKSLYFLKWCPFFDYLNTTLPLSRFLLQSQCSGRKNKLASLVSLNNDGQKIFWKYFWGKLSLEFDSCTHCNKILFLDKPWVYDYYCLYLFK